MVVLSHRRPALATACARKDLGEGPFPDKCKVRRLFRHVRQPARPPGGRALRTGRYLDLPSIVGVRALTARRSRRACAEHGQLRAGLFVGDATRGTCRSPPGPPRSHARARAMGTADRQRGLAHRCWLARPRFGSPGRRSGSRLTPERARVSSRSADSRRAARESARSSERKAFRVRAARGRSRAPPPTRASEPGTERSAARRPPADALGLPEATPTDAGPEEDAGLAIRRGG